MFSVALLSFARMKRKNLTLYVRMLLNFQMILQGHYFGLQDTPVLLKRLLKSTILPYFFHVITLCFYVRFIYYIQFYCVLRILLSVTYFVISLYFFVISHVLFVISLVLFCYQYTLETLI